MASTKTISSLEDYTNFIRDDMSTWANPAVAWFRGEPFGPTPLLPKVYRSKPGGDFYNENQLLQIFRMKAPGFFPGGTPDIHRTDQWLFLAQHVGLPTRLLDWTESALIGLYFALQHPNPIIWMLNPIELNLLSLPEPERAPLRGKVWFPLTWLEGSKTIRIPDLPSNFSEPKQIDPITIHQQPIGSANIRGAWELRYDGIPFPVAVQPTYLHPRMSAQRSVFTIHGAKKAPLCELVPESLLFCYEINPSAIPKLKSDLRMLGINHSTAFPDLDGLSHELADLY